METLEHNVRLRDRLAMFEIGPVFWPKDGEELPEEPLRLAIAMTGLRQTPNWDAPAEEVIDFYDLKGVLEALAVLLHIPAVRYEPADEPTFHPGKCARMCSGEVELGVFGELHPRVKDQFNLLSTPVEAADLDLEAFIRVIPAIYTSEGVPTQPPILEDIAVIVDENVPNARVEEVIRQGGGKMLVNMRLFDVFRGEQIGEGKKSLAYSLTYQSPERTLNDQEAAQIRQRIIRRLDQELGAKIRS